MPDLDELWYQLNCQPAPCLCRLVNLSRDCNGVIDGLEPEVE